MNEVWFSIDVTSVEENGKKYLKADIEGETYSIRRTWTDKEDSDNINMFSEEIALAIIGKLTTW